MAEKTNEITPLFSKEKHSLLMAGPAGSIEEEHLQKISKEYGLTVHLSGFALAFPSSPRRKLENFKDIKFDETTKKAFEKVPAYIFYVKGKLSNEQHGKFFIAIEKSLKKKMPPGARVYFVPDKNGERQMLVFPAAGKKTELQNIFNMVRKRFPVEHLTYVEDFPFHGAEESQNIVRVSGPEHIIKGVQDASNSPDRRGVILKERIIDIHNLER